MNCHPGNKDLADLLPRDLIVQSLLPRLDLTSRVRLAPFPSRPSPGQHTMDNRRQRLRSNSDPPQLQYWPSFPIHPLSHPPLLSVIKPPFNYTGCLDGNAILTSSIGEIVLYNPFSGETRRLIHADAAYERDFTQVRILPEHGLVVAHDVREDTIFASHFGQSDWVKSDIEYASDFIFHRHELYICCFGDIDAFYLQDLLTHPHEATSRPLFEQGYDLLPDFEFCLYHLVESRGELLLVMEPEVDCYVFEDEFLLAYKMELNEEGTKVSPTRINDLADMMLLVDETGSVSCPLPPDSTKSFTKNSTYFISHKEGTSDSHQMDKREVNNGGSFKKSENLLPPIPELFYNSGCIHKISGTTSFYFCLVWITTPHLKSFKLGWIGNGVKNFHVIL